MQYNNWNDSCNMDTSRVWEMGVPQGGVLFPVLFSIALRRIGEVHTIEVNILMYADDIIMYVTERGLEETKEILAIRKNPNFLEKKNVIWSTLYHKSSTDEKSHNETCTEAKCECKKAKGGDSLDSF